MADVNLMAKAEKYLTLFEEIKKKAGGDERIAQAVLVEVTKDRRMEEMREEREARNGEPATPKQLDYLKNLGVPVSQGLTKKQASELIDEALDKEEDE
jgi:hypothetical protein